MSDIPTFIENTLKLVNKTESKVSDVFGIPDLQCMKCQKIRTFERCLVYDIDTSALHFQVTEVNIGMLLDLLISVNNFCCKGNLVVGTFEEKLANFSKIVISK